MQVHSGLERKWLIGLDNRWHIWLPEPVRDGTTPTLGIVFSAGAQAPALAPVRSSATVTAVDADRRTLTVSAGTGATSAGATGDVGGWAWLDLGEGYQGPVQILRFASDTSCVLADPLPAPAVVGAVGRITWQTWHALISSAWVPARERNIRWALDYETQVGVVGGAATAASLMASGAPWNLTGPLTLLVQFEGGPIQSVSLAGVGNIAAVTRDELRERLNALVGGGAVDSGMGCLLRSDALGVSSRVRVTGTGATTVFAADQDASGTGNLAGTAARRLTGVAHVVRQPFATGLTEAGLLAWLPAMGAAVPRRQSSWWPQIDLAESLLVRRLRADVRALGAVDLEDSVMGQALQEAHAMLAASIILGGHVAVGAQLSEPRDDFRARAWSLYGEVMRCVPWIDLDGDGVIDAGETALGPVIRTRGLFSGDTDLADADWTRASLADDR